MATNIFGGRQNVVFAKVTASFSSMGINAGNTNIIFLMDDPPPKSYKPERLINPISGSVAGKGYIFQPNTDLDLTAYFEPPFANGDLWAAKDW